MLTKKVWLIIFALFLSAICINSCKAQDTKTPDTKAAASAAIKTYKEISTDELNDLQKSGEPFILINTLALYFYRKEHILNSLNMPADEINLIAPKLIRLDAKIVLYCAGLDCHVSHDAAQKLTKVGYKNISIYTGGMKEWKEKGNKISGLITGEEKPPVAAASQ